MNPEIVTILNLLSISTPADLRSYLHIREYRQVHGLTNLVGHARGRAFYCREFPDSTTLFVVNEGMYLHFKFNSVGQLTAAQVVKDLDDAS